MEVKYVNVLVTSFGGLGLPPTLCLPLPPSTSIRELWEELDTKLPRLDKATFQSLVLTTTNNTYVPHDSPHTLAALTDSPRDEIVPLRLSIELCGGKGGFGSQLRAAGGRMSSKRKKGGGDPNASSRNLEGRRLRTITEAKALAEYLAIKPEMEQKEKEKRRERWTQIVEAAERREEEIKDMSRSRLDGKWMEDKDEAREMAQDAVKEAMKNGLFKDNLLGTSAGSASSAELEVLREESADAEGPDRSSGATTPDSGEGKGKGKEATVPAKPRTFFGFDEEDEFMSSDDEHDGDKQ